MEYFLALSEEQRGELEKAGFQDYDVREPLVSGVAKLGIKVSDVNLNWVLYILGLKKVSEVLIKNGYKEVVCGPGTPFSSQKVYAVNWPTDIYDFRGPDHFIKIVMNLLLPVIKKQILIFCYRRGMNAPAFEKDPFHIHVWSSRKGHHSAGNDRRPNSIFGIPTSPRWNWFAPANLGKVFYTGNAPIAEIIGNNLFIFPPLHYTDFEKATEIFAKIIEQVAIWLSLDNETRSTQEAEYRRRLFLLAALSTTVSERDAVQADVARFETQIRQFGERAVINLRTYQDAKKKLVTLMDSSLQRENCGREFDSLLRNIKIKKIAIEDQVLRVYTHCLFCKDPRTGKTHELGRFEIRIDQEDGISFFNLTRRVCGMESGMQAPHVFSGGNACWGNAEELVQELLQKGEFEALIAYCIQYLESVNVEDSAGQYINCWPEVQQQVPSDTAPVSAA